MALVEGHCPEWVNQELLAKILRGDEEPITEENRVDIYHIKADPAVGKGENFSSDLTRVSVKYTKGHKKGFKFAFIILKSDLVTDNYDDMLDDFNVFKREIACYQKVLPRVYALLASIGDSQAKLSPTCYTIAEAVRPRYFAFEDLKHLSYVNVDRRVGLDVAHLRLAIVKLAKWHAATAHLALIDPNTMANHQFRNINPDVKHFHPFFEGAMRAGAEVVRTWPGCERFGEKLSVLVDTIIAKNCEVFKRDEQAFNVLTHGDLWINNIMYKYDGEGRPIDAVFVDYAVGYHGSPGIDLSYLLFTSNTEANGEADWDALLRDYHTELVANLKKLGFTGKIPSLLDIYIEYLTRSYYGIMISVFIIPLRLIEDSKDADLGGLLGDSPEKVAFRKMLFSAPKYRAFLEPLLRFWDSKGLLDA